MKKAFSSHYDVLNVYKRVIIDDMEFDGCTVEPADISDVELLSKVNSYCEWLADKLSQNGFVSNKEVHSYLESIGL